LNGDGELVDKVNALIRWQNTKAGISGFITGLGGIISSRWPFQLNFKRHIYTSSYDAAIAHM
jgi:hypothetical protein